MKPANAVSAFGRHLKHWRRQRGVSQLDLAILAQVSQRHVSFIETGRSRPGGETIHRIAEALAIPLRERNVLLKSAGLAEAYPELPMDAGALAPFRSAISRLLKAQEPYPAFVINRWWDVVDGNAAARRLFPLADDAPLNFVEHFFGPGPMREMIINYPAVAWAALRRLRAEAAHSGVDARLEGLMETARRLLADVPAPADEAPGDELVTCPHLLWGGEVIKTISVMARFGHTREVTLDELRVELMLPQDEKAEAFFHALAQGG